MRLREPAPAQKDEARRQEIIDSATLVFSEVGFRSATMRQVAELRALCSVGAWQAWA